MIIMDTVFINAEIFQLVMNATVTKATNWLTTADRVKVRLTF